MPEWQILQLFNLNRIPRCQPPADTIQLTVAALLVTQLLAPFGGSVLAGEHGGGLQISSRFDQVVQNLNAVLRISADGEVVNEQELDASVVFQTFPVPVQILSSA